MTAQPMYETMTDAEIRDHVSSRTTEQLLIELEARNWTLYDHERDDTSTLRAMLTAALVNERQQRAEINATRTEA